ncbi:MAG: hypothetical protein JWL71_3450 [Acidobacteria bacterium]|nr:hypothetical protein [Acidobacteriota bacterium]
MAEQFLEEQIKRIREMTEQVSRVRPLCGYELRNYLSELNGTPRQEPAPVRKGNGRGSSRRRGR